VHRIVSRSPDRLGSNRGDWIVVIARDTDRTTLLRLTDELTGAVEGVLPAASVRWGVSAPCQHAIDLPAAFRQAQAALTVGSRIGRSRVVFDELGVVRLLFSDTGGFRPAAVRSRGPRFPHRLRHPPGRRPGTLQACFDGDCSQEKASEAIPVHHKTLRYRLNKIEKPVST
jgi:sugar diacid utilization regulator